MEPNAPQSPVFFGEHELTTDDKNRLSVPAEVRKAFDPMRDGKAFFVTIGINGVIWLTPAKYYERLAFQVPNDLTPGEEQLAYDQMTFALASRLEWDGQGRILIPDKTLKRTGTGREVTLIGARDHLELWNRSAWESHRQALELKRVEVALKAKQARQKPADN